MKTLSQTEPSFETNANQTGLQTFKMEKQGTTPDNRNVYIYSRTDKSGKVVAFEVIIPKFIQVHINLKRGIKP